MMRCCECKKIVWPWNESTLTIGIHKTCHQRILTAAAKDPHMRKLMSDELRKAASELGYTPNVHVSSNKKSAPLTSGQGDRRHDCRSQ